MPVTFANESTASVSVNDAVEGVDKVGALLTVTELAVDAVAGPVFPAVSLAPLAANRGATVPFTVHDTVTVRVVLDVSVPGSKVHVAVPVFVKSAAATPVTASEKTREYVKLVEPVGELCADENDEIVGAVVSTTIA